MMRWPTATRKPLAATAVLGLLVVLLSLLAPARAGGPVARVAVSVHAAAAHDAAAHDGAFQLPSPPDAERQAAAQAALLPPLVLVAFALPVLAAPRQRPGPPPRSVSVLPRRSRAPPTSP
jgi:hypothetical protein